MTDVKADEALHAMMQRGSVIARGWIEGAQGAINGMYARSTQREVAVEAIAYVFAAFVVIESLQEVLANIARPIPETMLAAMRASAREIVDVNFTSGPIS